MNIENTNVSNLHTASNGRSAICYAHLYHADCFDIMPKIESKSIDLILADLPYGTTACKWDSILPFDKLWNEYERLITDNGAIVLFGAEPFSSKLRLSNEKLYKYDWFFEKDRETGFLNCKKQPMRKIETISIFYKNQCIYNPILREKPKENIRPQKKVGKSFGTYGIFKHDAERTIPLDKSYPTNLLNFARDKSNFHPTQKPIELLKYLIKTYTNKGMTILDNTMGSGSTGVAAKMLQRNFIGIEKELNYFEIAQKRIDNTIIETSIFDCA